VPLFTETDINELESRLPGSTGKERIEILVELARLYLKKAPQKALAYGQEALELLESFPDETQQMKILTLVSKANSLLGEFQLAEDFALKSQVIAQKIGDKSGEADALVSLSRIYWEQGNFHQAGKYCVEAQKLYKDSGNQKGLALTLQMLGTLYWRMGDLPKALDYALKSTKIFAELDNRLGMAVIDSLIAMIYSTQGQYEKALEYSFKSKQSYELLGDKNGIAMTLNNIGRDYRSSGNYKEALKHLIKASEMFLEMKSIRLYSYTLNNIGEVYYAMGKFHQAQDYFNRSLKIKEEIKDQMGTAYTLINIGKTYRKLDQHKEAIQPLLRALDIASEINIKNEIRNASKELAETYEALGNHPKALLYHKKYKEINDSIFNEKNSKKIAELQTRYETEKKEKEIALLKRDKETQRNLINSLIIVSLLIFLLALYTRYRLKMKAARALSKEIEDRKRVEAELIKSQKMEAVGILAGGISHDFNNLLSIIVGNLTLAEDDMYDNPTAAAQQLKAAEKACDQASELSQKLITISAGGGIMGQKITVSEMIENTVAHYPEMKPLTQNFSVSPGLKPIYGEKRQLRQVIYNLLKNANQAMTEPKEVTIRAENIFLGKTNDFSLPEGDYIKISIEDNGKGIPQDELGKIFVPYFSTNDNVTQKGRGLGLPFCYSIIKRHKGHITIKSEVGKGTTVELYLPAYPTNL
jgi:signal transduction histidine kinase/Tfp pilus assembly protein PilF